MGRTLALHLTETAEADLTDIWINLAIEVSEIAATKFVAAIEATLQPLRHFPLAAPSREHLGPGLRVAFHGSYAIYYRPLPDAIVVVRVLHGARDAAAPAERGGFA